MATALAREGWVMGRDYGDRIAYLRKLVIDADGIVAVETKRPRSALVVRDPMLVVAIRRMLPEWSLALPVTIES